MELFRESVVTKEVEKLCDCITDSNTPDEIWYFGDIIMSENAAYWAEIIARL